MFYYSGHTRLQYRHKQSTSRLIQSIIEGKEYLRIYNRSDSEATIPDYKSPAEVVVNESDTRILGAPKITLGVDISG